MRFLVDNNVPRSVTYAIRRWQDAVEVRSALGHNARDQEIAAYAASQGMIVVTHDAGMAHRCRDRRLPHLWLRTREWRDEERLVAEFDAIVEAFRRGAVRVALHARVLRVT